MYFVTLASIIVIALGLIVLHYRLTYPSSELKVAGWVLIIGGITNIVAAYNIEPPFQDNGRRLHNWRSEVGMPAPMPGMPMQPRVNPGMPMAQPMPAPAPQVPAMPNSGMNNKMMIEAPPPPAPSPTHAPAASHIAPPPPAAAPARPAPAQAVVLKPAAPAPAPAPVPAPKPAAPKKSDAYSPPKPTSWLNQPVQTPAASPAP